MRDFGETPGGVARADAPLAAFLDSLNPEQRQGAETVEGPVLVIAGAGSGKTRMLTARIVNLMGRHGVPGHHILAVTFTNKAAGEMRSRIAGAFGLDPGALTPPPFFAARDGGTGPATVPPASALFTPPAIGTFHAICARLLRREIGRTPFTRQFVIYDDSDQLALVKECFAKAGVSDKSFSPKNFQWAINSAKCQAVEPHEMRPEAFDVFGRNLAKVYSVYQQELVRSNALDFGEIITMAYRLLRDNPDLLEKYQRLYRYVHVDEYQDTNRAQYLLVNLLASSARNICVVGDEDQSIYKWRGADIRNILDFEKDYPEARVIKLERNYRSTKNIIGASSHLVARNTQRKSKSLWTENGTGAPIRRFQVSDERAEAELVVGRIRQACASEGFAFSDIAVFYRTNAQSRVFEDVLRRERVPYRIVGGLRFYDRKEIKDVMAYLRVLANPDDAVSFRRILNVPHRGIGKSTVEKVDEIAIRSGAGFERALRIAAGTARADAAEGGAIPSAAGAPAGPLSSAPRKKLAEFLSLVDGLRARMAERTILELYHELMDRTGYVQELRAEGTEESRARIENLQELNTIFQEFGRAAGAAERAASETLPAFLESVALIGEQDETAGAAGSVSLMTLHMSKGLEFPVVFMVGLEEGLCPLVRGDDDPDDADIEEERRLCYVGMTRAMKELHMTHAVCRRIYGNILYNDPSRFFREIPERFVELHDLARFRRDDGDLDRGERRTGAAGGSVLPGSSRIGLRVRHGVYGEGVIRGIEGGDSPGAKVTVEFAGRVTRKFILKFANLEFLG